MLFNSKSFIYKYKKDENYKLRKSKGINKDYCKVNHTMNISNKYCLMKRKQQKQNITKYL